MTKTMMVTTALVLALSAPASAQQRGFYQQNWDAYTAYGQGGSGANYIVPDFDINRRLPTARNSQTGGHPNNPNLGPVDRVGNVPSDNR
jgi:hypothetical protein